ncbi:hypothetical protein ABIA33_007688 [Streptacidiphilus sp. MAP12-16]
MTGVAFAILDGTVTGNQLSPYFSPPVASQLALPARGVADAGELTEALPLLDGFRLQGISQRLSILANPLTQTPRGVRSPAAG